MALPPGEGDGHKAVSTPENRSRLDTIVRSPRSIYIAIRGLLVSLHTRVGQQASAAESFGRRLSSYSPGITESQSPV